jgi:hypothetical protein
LDCSPTSRCARRSSRRGNTSNWSPVNGPEAGEIRFRFPFPHEDGKPPGNFEPFFGLAVHGIEPPEECDHNSLQFTRNYPQSGGILLSTPCPESKEGKASGLKFHYNGYSGKVRISQQRIIGDELWTVCECGSCGSKWRCDRESAERLPDVRALVPAREPSRDLHDQRRAPQSARGQSRQLAARIRGRGAGRSGAPQRSRSAALPGA